jgi:protein phosphatase-4 regulatory subunit 3
MENNKSLVAHLVENYGERLAGVDYVDTFSALRLKYDQV